MRNSDPGRPPAGAGWHSPKPGSSRPGGRPAFQRPHGHQVTPSRESLGGLLVRYGVRLPDPVVDKVWQYHQLLRKNNTDQDLTRLIGFETIVQRHYAEPVRHRPERSLEGVVGGLGPDLILGEEAPHDVGGR